MRQPHFIILSIIHLLSENKIRKQQKADTRLRVSAKNLCSVGEKGSGEVSVAGVGEKNDNCFALVFGTLSKLDGRKNGGAGGNSDQNAFLVSDLLAGGKGVVVGNGDNLIVYLCVKHIGNEACADALNFMSAGNAGGKNCRGGGLNSNDLYVGFFGFEIFTDAGNGSAGADACDKMSTCPSVSS